MARPSACYVEWLSRDSSFSPQPYEQLAGVFRRTGDPVKANDILYEARERQRRGRGVLGGFGLWMLRATIGYGLGHRYFWALWWVLGFTLLGTVLLITLGHHSEDWPRDFFASFDQLLPIVTLNKSHDVLIFGDPSATPLIDPQPYGLVVYFYFHKMVGWVLATFIVAGLAGLTQRN